MYNPAVGRGGGSGAPNAKNNASRPRAHGARRRPSPYRPSSATTGQLEPERASGAAPPPVTRNGT